MNNFPSGTQPLQERPTFLSVVSPIRRGCHWSALHGLFQLLLVQLPSRLCVHTSTLTGLQYPDHSEYKIEKIWHVCIGVGNNIDSSMHCNIFFPNSISIKKKPLERFRQATTRGPSPDLWVPASCSWKRLAGDLARGSEGDAPQSCGGR